MKAILLSSLLIVGICSVKLTKQHKAHRPKKQKGDFPKNPRDLYFLPDFAENLQYNTGSEFTNQLDNTNSNVHQLISLSARINTYKNFAQWFADLEENMDNYRNTVSRKLDDFHMNVQRPKVPMNGPPQLAFNALGSYAQGINETLKGQATGFADFHASQHHEEVPDIEEQVEELQREREEDRTDDGIESEERRSK